MTDTPEQVALEYFRRWNAGDFEGLCELFAEDMVWCIKGRFPQAGEYPREMIAGMLKLIPRFDVVEPFLLHVTNMVADNRCAAVEFTSTLKFRDGREYLNDYHFLLFVENGKITRGHEYLCTYTATFNGIGEDFARVAVGA
ncbi:nuclear transport factor 2 family protein [Novosphingobium sp. PASSN1]|uniref:nuclear transport factor 2 family protein n=1 Tax=Novosphingobium sp. PASSN1 TaxID=2015561 RepID=UPI000BD793FF|nr:nuclear transport factor 2 family protein [Novosphingobium sp. PASSN1]OYU34724.1 MAG: hypothetical protein CFE35_12590 [Novosphingobium sp. PASSN1]